MTDDTSPSGDDRPSPEPVAEPDGGPIAQFRNSDNAAVVFVRETLSSAAIVAVIGAVLFLIAGVWPPMVAVESGSMTPNMKKGDLIFVTEPGRYAAPFADDNGIVTTQAGAQNGHVQFAEPGSVVVYRAPGRIGPPIIHRARFHVEDGENWVGRADPSALPPGADTCDEVRYCPAPHAGYITKGDDNGLYDQVNSIGSPPVKADWISGVARVRIPLLGWIRLVFSGELPEFLGWVSVDPGTLPGDPVAADSGESGAVESGAVESGAVESSAVESGAGGVGATTGASTAPVAD